MKRALLIATVAFGIVGLAMVSLAGDYHVGTQLICSECHVMHGSAKHSWTDDTSQPWVVPGSKSATPPPYEYLLRQESVNTACLGCHDSRSDAPDVLTGNFDATGTPNGRMAGALNAAGGHGFNNTGNYTTDDGHTLWSTEAPPGLVGTTDIDPVHGLQCSDCHSVHGSANYRNLRSSTTTTSAWYNRAVTYEIGGTPTNAVAVFERAPHNYDFGNVDYQEPDATGSPYGNWCAACHGNFHGAPGAAPITIGGVDVRHPTAGVNMSSSRITRWRTPVAGHRLKLMDGTGQWNGNTSTMTPSCFTCHKSHGNDAKFGLIFPVGPPSGGPGPDIVANANMTEEGDGQPGVIRDLCRNCHGTGTFPTGNPTNILP